MDGFKNSTKTQYMRGGSCEGYAKGGSVKGAAKIAKVMGEFKAGTLHSGSKSGPEVTNPKQAVAISLSEARKAGAKLPMKKAEGGAVLPANYKLPELKKTDNPADGGMGPRISLGGVGGGRVAGNTGPSVGSQAPGTYNRPSGLGVRVSTRFAEGGAVGRGNRVSAEEAGEDRVISRRRAKTPEVDYSRFRNYDNPEAKRAPSELSIRLTKRGPAGARHDDTPLLDRMVGAVRDTLGFAKGGAAKKGGGLSAMPRKK